MRQILTQKDMADAYQPLFDLMSKVHGLTLLKSEMDDIIDAVARTTDKLGMIYREVCDVAGCDMDAGSQGWSWRDKGYWCVCSHHANLERNGMEFPEMKPEALHRESSRGTDGRLPIGYHESLTTTP